MKAKISAQAGIAVLIDRDKIYSIDVDAPDPPRCRKLSEVRQLLNFANDIVEITVESPDEARKMLQTAVAQDRALQFILILLDRDAVMTSRQLSVKYLEAEWPNTKVWRFVMNRLFAHPAGETGDIEGAMALASAKNATNILEALRRLRNRQTDIRITRDAWDDLPVALFANSQQKNTLEHYAIESGLFYRYASDRGPAENVYFECSEVEKKFRSFFNGKRILDEWKKTIGDSIVSYEQPVVIVADQHESRTTILSGVINQLCQYKVRFVRDWSELEKTLSRTRVALVVLSWDLPGRYEGRLTFRICTIFSQLGIFGNILAILDSPEQTFDVPKVAKTVVASREKVNMKQLTKTILEVLPA